MQDIQKAQSRRGGERASDKYLLKWPHHPWTHLLGKKKMGEEIYGQHKTCQAGTGKRGGRAGKFLTSFISARKGSESSLEPGKPLEAAWALGGLASREPQHAEHNSLHWPTIAAAPSINPAGTRVQTKMALPAHLNHTQSSLCDKILPRPWKCSVLSVLTAQTQVQVSWVVCGFWFEVRGVGGGALFLMAPSSQSHPSPLLHKGKFSLALSQGMFPFMLSKKLALVISWIWVFPQI